MKTFSKIYVFQLCNLDHIFSPTYLYIYQTIRLREKSHWVERSFFFCFFFEEFLFCVKYNSKVIFLCSLFPKIIIGTSVILILSFNLFKKILLPAQSQSQSRLVRKLFLHYLNRSFILHRNFPRNFI